MQILLYDVLADAVDVTPGFEDLLNPSLAGGVVVPPDSKVVFTLKEKTYIDSVGLGGMRRGCNTEHRFWVNGAWTESQSKLHMENGLYKLITPYAEVEKIEIHNPYLDVPGEFYGRVGYGKAISLCTNIPKEVGYHSTNIPRETEQGQIVAGLGGYNYRTLSLESSYRVTHEFIDHLVAGQKFIGRGYPFFVWFDSEAYKLPFSRLYATSAKQRDWIMQGGLMMFRYSIKFDFEERF